jgi:glutamate-1-semialdehyde aminotransferase
VQELCNGYGTILIFDEMVTGFRWALAGGQEYFGVVPDLATFGKAAANGLPIALLCGKKEFMQHAELVQGGTFGGEVLSMAACNAVLDVYEQEPVIETLWVRGKQLQKQFNDAAHSMDVDAVCDGFPCKPRINFFPYAEPTQGKRDSRRKLLAMSLFLQETAAQGVLFHPVNCNVSTALTDEDMKITFHAVELALRAVAIADKNDDWSTLKGQPIQPVVPLRG